MARYRTTPNYYTKKPLQIPYIQTQARNKSYINQFGYPTEEFPTVSASPGLRRSSYVRVDDPKKIRDNFDKNPISDSTRITNSYPGMSLYIGEGGGIGNIRDNKTPEQVKAQLARVQKNAEYLKQRDGENRKEIKIRLRRTQRMVKAYEDFNALGVPMSESAKTAAMGNNAP